jgi:hypothetical protein
MSAYGLLEPKHRLVSERMLPVLQVRNRLDLLRLARPTEYPQATMVPVFPLSRGSALAEDGLPGLLFGPFRVRIHYVKLLFKI